MKSNGKEYGKQSNHMSNHKIVPNIEFRGVIQVAGTFS